MTEDQYCPHGLLKRHCPGCAWDEVGRLRAENSKLKDENELLRFAIDAYVANLAEQTTENKRLRAAIRAIDEQSLASTERDYFAVPTKLVADAVSLTRVEATDREDENNVQLR